MTPDFRRHQILDDKAFSLDGLSKPASKPHKTASGVFYSSNPGRTFNAYQYIALNSGHLSGTKTRRPGPLKVKSPKVTAHIDNLPNKEQTRLPPRLERFATERIG